MYGNRGIRLFKIFGFEVRIDLSWFLLALLIVWSLSGSFFPAYYNNLNYGSYLLMAILGAIGLFASIILHELAHSLVARRYGVKMNGITLFIFGGVAEMNDEPKSAKAEFLIAGAGPLLSIVIGLFFGALYLASSFANAVVFLQGVFFYLFLINIVLVIFNLVPAFPLDGGRILRAVLWYFKKNFYWATKVSSRIGGAFGILLIVAGIISFIMGNFVNGLWWTLIGLFIYNISGQSYQQLKYKKNLEGISVTEFIKKDDSVISENLSLDDLVKEYIYKYHYNTYPFVKDSEFKGCIDIEEVKSVPKDRWKEVSVEDIIKKCSRNEIISSKAKASEALKVMQETNNKRLFVIDDNKLTGMVSLYDILGYLRLRKDFGFNV